MQTIHYRVVPSRPTAHLFAVECTVPEPNARGQRFSLPAWITGSYVIRDFAGDVVTLRASSDGNEVRVEKLDKQTWVCEPVQEALTLHYEVYAWDGSVRTAYLDTQRGFFNGTSLFLSPHGCEANPVEITLEPPTHPDTVDWELTTAMAPVETDSSGFGIYRAEHYEELIDHPVEMGALDRIPFKVGGIDHQLVLAGRHSASTGRLASDLKALCSTQVKLFQDGRPPMDHYLFLTRVVGSGYGGLEHRASSSLICARDALPVSGKEEADERYRVFLGLCSHEYFHIWNVKRIRPEAFARANRGLEAYTEDLWAYEGITAYYDHLMLVRAGLITLQQYLEHLARSATRLWHTPARYKQSLAESSHDAWIKFYRQGSDAPNSVVSYYNKGALVALCLDLKLRLETEGNTSLDDVMRALWNQYGKQGTPVPERGIEAVAKRISGLQLDAFFESMIRGTEDPPLEALLPAFGVDYTLQGANEADASRPNAYLGLSLRKEQDKSIVAHVLEESPAQQTGLSPGDELVAVNGLRVGSDGLDRHARLLSPGRDVTISAFRRDELMDFDITPATAPKDTWTMKPAADMAESVSKRRDSWLWLSGQQAETT